MRNNSYIFPLGLGVLAVNASRITDEMLMESSRALLRRSPLAINVLVLYFHHRVDPHCI
ncbi:hypothetical protein OK016_01500 [Vibrio chagasii]|nr:hypothetical protein [Vibrio chagasii]